MVPADMHPCHLVNFSRNPGSSNRLNLHDTNFHNSLYYVTILLAIDGAASLDSGFWHLVAGPITSLEVNSIACKRPCGSCHRNQGATSIVCIAMMLQFSRQECTAFALPLEKKGREGPSRSAVWIWGNRYEALDRSRVHFGGTSAIGGTGPIMQSVQESLKPLGPLLLTRWYMYCITAGRICFSPEIIAASSGIGACSQLSGIQQALSRLEPSPLSCNPALRLWIATIRDLTSKNSLILFDYLYKNSFIKK